MSGSLNTEFNLRNAVADCGVPKSWPIGLGQLTLNDGTTIAASGSGVPHRQLGSNSLNQSVIQWDAASDASDIVRFSFVLPDDFKTYKPFGSPANPKIVFKCWIRKYNTGGASDNTDLKLTLQAFWKKGSSATTNTLATAPTVTAPAMVTTNVFTEVSIDITASMTEAQLKALEPGMSFDVQLYPHETVGTALALEITALRLNPDCHAHA